MQSECCPAGLIARTLTTNADVAAGTANECLLALAGDDTLVYAAVIHGGPGRDTIMSAAGGTVRGGSGDDTVNAYQGARVNGNAGNDTINAANGANFVVPGPGRDQVVGGVDNDTVAIYDLCEVVAGESLDGGAGVDTLISPVSKAQLIALGVSVQRFETVVVDPQACMSECVTGNDCSGHGDCVDGGTPGTFSCTCEPPFTGTLCDECLPPFTGPNCDECIPPATGPGCTECIPPATGPGCTECEPPFTGPSCSECLPPFTGPDCTECIPPFTGPECQDCLLPFDGETCENCVQPLTGPNCDECPEGTFGPNCDACDPTDPDACSGQGECVAGNGGSGANCLCKSGHAGPDCADDITDSTIVDNEGPDTFSNHQLPLAEDLGDHFGGKTLSVHLTQQGDACTWSHAFQVDALGEVALAYTNETSNNEWNMTVLAPNDLAVTWEESENYSVNSNSDPLSGGAAEFQATTTGTYELRLTSAKPCAQLPSVEGEASIVVAASNRVLYVNQTTLQNVAGGTLAIQARVYDRQENPDPQTNAQDHAPLTWTQGEVSAAYVTFFPPGQNPTAELPMFDSGLSHDANPNDGIFGRAVTATAGAWAYRVRVVGTDAYGQAYERTGTGAVEVAKPTVRFESSGSENARMLHVDDDTRFSIVLNLRPAPGLESGEYDQLAKLTDAVDFSTQLWAIRESSGGDQEIPIAWASGIREPDVLRVDPDNDVYYLSLETEFDPRWLANAGVLQIFNTDDPVHFEMRSAVLLDDATAAVRDQRATIEVDASEVMDWLQSLPRDTVTLPDSPEYQEMLTGAPPEFVEAIKDSFATRAFPEVQGQTYLSSGWCGDPGMWVKERIGHDGQDAAGNDVRDRLVWADDLWFVKNKTQVHVRTFRDELVSELQKPENDEVAEVWGYSQGGVAATLARRYWTPLDAFRREGHPQVHTLSAEFYGTPFSQPWRFLPTIIRNVVRRKWGCATDDFETPGLGRGAMTTRMVLLPDRVSREVRYNAVSHKTSGLAKNRCNTLVSKVYLWGDDDGMVQTRKAKLEKGGANGPSTFKPFCHGGSDFYLWPFPADDQDVISKMCSASFFADPSLEGCEVN
jgi:hypothetical protein